jgi:hypothetical protein
MKQSNAFHVYKGNYIYKKTREPSLNRPLEKIYSKNAKKKAVVFDLDETVGSFSDLYDIWTNIYSIDIEKTVDELSLVQKQVFFHLLDLFPEFLRPGIIPIFQSIVERIQKDQCHKICIYTNNQCEAKYWVSLIISYLDSKLGVSIGSPSWFSPPVCAFKIGDRIIEPRRTTNDKTYSDLVKCVTLPPNVEICFLDDAIHNRMKTPRVFYIHPPAYSHELSKTEIFARFRSSHVAKFLFPKEKIVIPIRPPNIPPTVNSKNQKHVEVYYKILFFLEEFFSMILSQSHAKTMKNGKSYFETETKSYDASSFFNECFSSVERNSARDNGIVDLLNHTRFRRTSNTRKNRAQINIEKVMEKYKYTEL